MNEDQVRALVQSILQSGQYSVSKVPYHIHNGVDSPLLPSSTPAAAFTIVASGTSPALNSSYVVTITNSAITTSSTCIAVHCTAATDGSGNTGNISVFSQSAGSVTFTSDSVHDRSTLNYVIINPS